MTTSTDRPDSYTAAILFVTVALSSIFALVAFFSIATLGLVQIAALSALTMAIAVTSALLGDALGEDADRGRAPSPGNITNIASGSEDKPALPIAHLENWYYKEPLLWGVVTGHINIPDGNHIHTSTVQSIDALIGLAVTRNTIYTLGKEREWVGRGSPSDVAVKGERESASK
jgi:hypothetical protein